MAGIEAAAIGPFGEAIKSSFCFCCARAEYFDDLEVNLRSTKNEIRRLEKMKEYVDTRVRREKKPYLQTVHKVTDWLKRVDLLKGDAEEIIEEGEEEIRYKFRRWFCPKHCCSYNKVGKTLSERLKAVKELIKDGDFDVVVERRAGELVNEMHVPQTMGLESELEEVCRWTNDPNVEIIGLYGIGGVGKTTLLKKIYNRISSTTNDVVIWVEKWGQDPVKSVQEAIRKKFSEVPEDLWKNKEESDSEQIWKLLRSEKFVLMLDDIGEQWRYHLLEQVRVPLNGNDNGSKIIITTRSRDVCDKMRAKSIEIQCLAAETALELFQLYVGQGILNSHPEIPKLARDAAEVCKGLPLLLTTIARAMATKTNFRDWKHQVQRLKSHPAKFENVESNVFSILKVSYDTLSTDALKKCFLYFSLFPKGIKKEELIELWISEGFLNASNNVYDAREEGEDIIASLKLASLLESGKSEDFVKMHDAIYEMALWLACEEGKAEDRILVQNKMIEDSKWVNAERVSLWDLSIPLLPQTPCNHLTTLLLRAANLNALPSEFFQTMHALRVLDLSDNQGLAILPAGIGQLTGLHYLNLSGTSITTLPLEVQNLKELLILIIGHPVNIERGLISSLFKLAVFRMLVDSGLLINSTVNEVNILEEMECLETINEISIVLSSVASVQKLLESPKLQRCIKQLTLRLSNQDSLSLPKLSLRRMKHIEKLEILNCASLNEVEVENENEVQSLGSPNCPKLFGQECFLYLGVARISSCKILNVTWLIHAPNLQTLALFNCCELVEVISGSYGDAVFSKLVDISLEKLPKLLSIYHQDLQFPSLISLRVDWCPKLRELPFGSNSAKNLKEIRGEKSWWDGLKWKSKAIENAFFLKLKRTKQKITIMISNGEDKARSKALKVAIGVPGVEVAGFGNKRQIQVIGHSIDAVALVLLVRKKVGHAYLVSVGFHEDKEED